MSFLKLDGKLPYPSSLGMAGTMPFTSLLGSYRIMGLESCSNLSQSTQRVTPGESRVLTSLIVTASSPLFINPTQKPPSCPWTTYSVLELGQVHCAFPHHNHLPHPFPGVSLSDLIAAFPSPPMCTMSRATFMLRPGLGTSGLGPRVS